MRTRNSSTGDVRLDYAAVAKIIASEAWRADWSGRTTDDLIQQGWVRALEIAGRDARSFGAYLRTALRRHLAETSVALRRWSAESTDTADDIPADERTAEDRMHAAQVYRDLRRVLRELGAYDHATLTALYGLDGSDELSPADVARESGRSLNAVYVERSKLFARARRNASLRAVHGELAA